MSYMKSMDITVQQMTVKNTENSIEERKKI